MTLGEELRAMLTAAVDRDPVLSRILDSEDRLVALEGTTMEVVQQAVSALNAYCDVLLRMTLRVAEAVDNLG
jgi:hypothetical protein